MMFGYINYEFILKIIRSGIYSAQVGNCTVRLVLPYTLPMYGTHLQRGAQRGKSQGETGKQFIIRQREGKDLRIYIGPGRGQRNKETP